jgi:outer membrane protein assembly factor BamA
MTAGSALDAQTSLRVLPVLGSAPETGLVGGATALRVTTSRSDTLTRASTEQLYAAYTAKRQFRAFASTDRWSAGNRWGMTAQVEYQRFPQPYFGVGVDAPESAEEWYEPTSVIASASVLRRFSHVIYGQVGYRFVSTKIRDVEEGGVIALGAPLGASGGVVSQVVGGAAWDSRDNIFAPTNGAYASLTAGYSDRSLGADYRFARYTIDARRYLRVGSGILAGHGYVEATSGRPPFDQVALLGSGSIMRGYVRGRYRDRALAAAQVEYRVPVAGRLGVAAFAGAGTVAPGLSGLASSLLPTVGGGARWLLLPKQHTTVRVDYGVGKRSSGFYVAFNEAF